MLEEIKKIKLEELNKERFKYDEKRNAIKQRLNQIRNKLWYRWNNGNISSFAKNYNAYSRAYRPNKTG